MDPAARAIVAEALKHRLANAGRPALESLDHAMHRRRVGVVDFGRDVIPPSSFALLIALAFDGGRAREWERMHLVDRVAQAALLTVWAREVWPQFLARYGVE